MTFFPPEFLTLVEKLAPFLAIFWKIFGAWWWVILPFFLWPHFVTFYLFWRNIEYDNTVKKVFLEIKIPKEIKKSIKGMEYVFEGIHAIHDVANQKEKWVEGVFQHGFSLEIASIEGSIRFFIRCPESFRSVIESNIYSQYPEVEIIDAQDYTKMVPDDMPNKDWDLRGADMIMTNENPYPVRTYMDFEREAEIYEDRMIDPLSGLLEGMSTLGEGEQMWVQLVARPVLGKDKPWVNEGKKIINKLVHRPEKSIPRPMVLEFFDVLFGTGGNSEKKEEKELFPAEMRLTPGEKDIIQGIERKISKVGYDCFIRFIYLGKKERFFKPKARIPYGFFKALSTYNMNGFKPEKETMTRSKTILTHFLDKRIKYFKQRRMFLRYKLRLNARFPAKAGHFTFVLNTEELATIFHFPGQLVAPAHGIHRLESKKGEPPLELPIE